MLLKNVKNGKVIETRNKAIVDKDSIVITECGRIVDKYMLCDYEIITPYLVIWKSGCQEKSQCMTFEELKDFNESHKNYVVYDLRTMERTRM